MENGKIFIEFSFGLVKFVKCSHSLSKRLLRLPSEMPQNQLKKNTGVKIFIKQVFNKFQHTHQTRFRQVQNADRNQKNKENLSSLDQNTPLQIIKNTQNSTSLD
jgi:hypothetical protein